MLLGKKIIVILSAYNAEKTLQKTYVEIPIDIADIVILTDDFSNDKTISVGKISCPEKYFKEASSINFQRSLLYGIGCIRVVFSYSFQKLGILNFKLFA